MGQKTLHIYSDKVWINDTLKEASIVINDGKITQILPNQKLAACTDYSGKVIMPGVIDAHVHINEPGRTHWEGFETATKAAARGGTTTLVDMPLNSSPVVTSVAALDQKMEACKGKLHVNCAFWAGAINANFEEVKKLVQKGCLGVKVFLSHSGINEFPNISMKDLEILMKNLHHLDFPFLAHCEFDTLPFDDKLREHPFSYQAYLKSRPRQWENEAVKAFVGLSEQYKCRSHIVHLSSAEILDWLKGKKSEAVPFTVETCPHYLFFHAEEIADKKTEYKCAPPIREKANNQALTKALQSGLIDFITTDHSPAPPSLKLLEEGNLARAWGGIAGLQFLLSASWTVLRKSMELEAFIPLLTSKPASFLGLDAIIGKIALGYDADLTIWDPEASQMISKDMVEHRHKETPYLGHHLSGVVHTTIVNGKIVFEDGEMRNRNGGKLILGKQKKT